MNKMSFKTLEKLFLAKYENGAIFKDSLRSGRIYVCYNKNSKAYSYCYTNYLVLAQRLGLVDNNKVYAKTIESIKNIIKRENERLQEVISGEDTFYLGTKEEETESIKKRIKELEIELKESKVFINE